MNDRMVNGRGWVVVGIAFSADRQAFEQTESRSLLPHLSAPDQPVIETWLADAWLNESMSRLTAEECEAVLQDKVIACGWLPGETLIAVVEDCDTSLPTAMPNPIVGRISRAQYQHLVRRHFSKGLLARATHGLSKAMPWASANVRLSAGQMVAGVIFILFALCLMAFGQVLALQVMAQLGLGFLFAIVVKLRLLCLAPLPQRHFVKPKLLQDRDLPIYTLLVPLFRETEVLHQLLGALCRIDYPALCSNSTKRSESPWGSFPPWNSLKSLTP